MFQRCNSASGVSHFNHSIYPFQPQAPQQAAVHGSFGNLIWMILTTDSTGFQLPHRTSADIAKCSIY